MKLKIPSLASLDRFERIGLLLLFLSLVAAGMATVGYLLVGPLLIESMYKGASLPMLNQLIQYQAKYPLEHYLTAGHLLFFRSLFLFILFVVILSGLIFILYRLIFSEKPLPFLCLLALSILLQRLPFFLNPSWGFYYTHGLFRAALSYQVLIGHTPPLDPLYAGDIMRSDWAFPWLAAQVSRLFNITPFRSMNLINCICLGLTLWLIYRVASFLTKDRKARLFSSILPIFAITPFSHDMINQIGQLFPFRYGEWKATPLFIKYTSDGGDSLGIVFTLLAIWATFHLFQFKHTVRNYFLLGLSLLACGFFYPAFYPALCAGTATMSLVWFFCHSDSSLGQRLGRLFMIGAILVLSSLALVPYALQIGTKPGSAFVFCQPFFMVRNTILLLTLFVPLIVILVWKMPAFYTDPRRIFWLSFFAFSAVSATAYVMLHGPRNLEYKFLILTGLGLGISAGPVLYSIRLSRPWVCLILTLVFLYPSAVFLYHLSLRYENHPLLCVLSKQPVFFKGKYVYVQDSEENQLYQWIQTNTPKDAVFLDTSWNIPVFAHRRLWVGMDPKGGTSWVSGYLPLEVLQLRNGYNAGEMKDRIKTMAEFFQMNTPESLQKIQFLSPSMELYFVSRPEAIPSLLQSDLFVEVFCSSARQFRVYRLAFPGNAGHE